jgi:hypothetical protein
MRLGHLEEARASLEEAIQSSQDPELRGRAQYLIGETHARGAAWEDAARALEGLDARSGLRGQASQAVGWIREHSPPSEKSPWMAGVLAAILPGAGHAYTDRWRDAGLVFSVNSAFTAATLEAIRKENHALAGGMALAELLWYSGNIFSAVGSAHKYNRALSRQLLEELQLPPAFMELPPWRGEPWRGSP